MLTDNKSNSEKDGMAKFLFVQSLNNAQMNRHMRKDTQMYKQIGVKMTKKNLNMFTNR